MNLILTNRLLVRLHQIQAYECNLYKQEEHILAVTTVPTTDKQLVFQAFSLDVCLLKAEFYLK